ncbi:MAG: hypothetical protein LBF38_00355 [Deltaproteobacteria bacterium]|jgi:hypothetical protein|nr:hypothetical protein [Deltaproteobacteria bacterium]
MTVAKPHNDFKVGGELELHCPKCQRKTSHKIVTIQGGQPKRVLCQACDHKYLYKATDPEGLEAAAETPDGEKAAHKGPLGGKGAAKAKGGAKAGQERLGGDIEPADKSGDDMEDDLPKDKEDSFGGDPEGDLGGDLGSKEGGLGLGEKKAPAKAAAKAPAKAAKPKIGVKVVVSKNLKGALGKTGKITDEDLYDEFEEVAKPKTAKTRARITAEAKLAREDRELKEAKKLALEEIEQNKEKWNDLKNRFANVNPVDYALSGDFAPEQVLRHGKFGLGFVLKVILPNKIEVQFEESVKTLVMRVPNV